jgi:hypothetical protein
VVIGDEARTSESCLLYVGHFFSLQAAVGEWEPGDDAVDQIPPKDNPILGHIIQKLFNIIYPPEVCIFIPCYVL